MGAGAALIGMRSEKTLPFPGVEDSVKGSDRTRAIRSTMERPNPSPSASRMPSSRRVNSRKTSFSFGCGIPIPVSSTCSSMKLPRRRTPNRMPPLRLYLIAFETRFWMRRRSMLRSVFTTMLEGTTRSLRPFFRAIGVKSVAIWLKSLSRRNTETSGLSAPVSSRDISSTIPRMASTDSSEESMLRASWLVSARPSFSVSAVL